MNSALFQRLRGVLWMLLGSVSFAGMGASVKLARRTAGVFDVVFARSLVVVILVLVVARLQGADLRPKRLGLLTWRAIAGLSAMMLFFWSLGKIELATSVTLLHTSPLWVILLSGGLLSRADERLRLILPAALVAFVGILLIIRPTQLEMDLGTLAALVAGLLAGFAYLAVRRLRHTDSPAGIVVFHAVVGVVCTAPLLSRAPWAFDPQTLGILALVGLCATGGQMFMTQAYRVERAEVVAPFSYATVALSFVIGVFAFDERLSPLALVGIGLVTGAGVVLSGRAHAREPGD